MKSSFVLIAGLLIAVCFAQDTFFPSDTLIINQDASSVSSNAISSIGCTVNLNGHTYTLLTAQNTLNPEYGSADPDPLSVLVDLNEKKSVYLGRTTSGRLIAQSLFTDGTYLYASLLRSGELATLSDGSISNVFAVLYKINPDLTVAGRVYSRNGIHGSFVSCALASSNKPVFLVKGEGIDIVAGEKTITSDEKGFFFITGLFEGEPEIIYKVTTSSPSPGEMSGSAVETGVDGKILASFNVESTLTTALIDVNNKNAEVQELTVEGTNDHISVVRIDATTYATVLTHVNSIKKDGTELFPDSKEQPRLIVIKHVISDGTIVSNDPVVFPLGKSSEKPSLGKHKSYALPHAVDGKIIVAAPYRSFNHQFCGTVLYTNLTNSEKAAYVLVFIDANEITCLSAQTLDPISDQTVTGLALSKKDQIAVSEFHESTSSKITIRTVLLDYVRCEDGVINYEKTECICYDSGRKCTSHDPPHHGGSSDSDTPAGKTSSSTGSKGAGSSSVAPPLATGNNPLLSYILIGVAGLFLITAVIFIILFAVA